MAGKDDRWQELADLLGLPEGEKPAAAKEAAPPPAPREPDEVRPVAHREEEYSRLEPVPEHVPMHESEFEDVGDETILDESPMVEEIVDEESFEEEVAEDAAEFSGTAEAPPAAGEEERPRKRRRRRRGRRGGGGRDGEERGERSQEQPRRQGDGRQQQRGDGRQQRSDGRRDERQPRQGGQQRRQPEEDHVQEEQPRPAPVMDAAEDTDFSDWNVPSWQELIASLYRPER
jgi:hypothetical protein